ncbi:MAG TPA: hypothetical protein VGR14_04070 [Verrucomicrobiae bacterium]|jgi:hypothetical protein|nr:hypothetical protein [Verrucomicrobiae bacterium]
MKNTFEAARAYLSKLPPAISGAGGHDATFRAACSLIRFGLADGDAMALLRQWNGTHCQPPWTEKELIHKLRDARRLAGRKARTITTKPAVRVVWKIGRQVAGAGFDHHSPPCSPPKIRAERPGTNVRRKDLNSRIPY